MFRAESTAKSGPRQFASGIALGFPGTKVAPPQVANVLMLYC
jgi:hypothetical protein